MTTTERYREMLTQYLLPHRGLLTLLCVFLFSHIGLQLINPQIMRHFIDAAKTGEPLNEIILSGILFLTVALVNQGFGIGSRYTSEKLAWTATNTLREDLTLHCLRLDMPFHSKHTPGEMIERIDGDIENLANFFSEFSIRLLGNMLLLIGVLVVLFYENGYVGLTMTVYAAVVMGCLILMRDLVVPHWKDAREANANLFGFLEEHLSGTEDIRANGATGHTMNLFYGFAGNRLIKELRAGLMNVRLSALTHIFRMVGRISMLILGYYLFNQDVMTIGTVFMIFQYTDMLFDPLYELTRRMEEFQRAVASMSRVHELTDTKTAIVPRSEQNLPHGPLQVRFDNVTFAYNPDEPVLHNLSFDLKPGKVLGLLGRTGSGKSTISRLLFRLYDVNEGAIQLSSHDLRDVTVSDLRRRVGTVNQNVQLFRGTVRDNLTFYDTTISDDHIRDVIDQMGLTTWFTSLPNGLNTKLENEGGGLSAGEAQLLTFTRVFLKDPGLLILDEASSRLDPTTEAQIENAVDHLLQNRTGIIIAHRLATVQRADDILILEDGRISEYGDRLQLMQDANSKFNELIKTGMTEVQR